MPASGKLSGFFTFETGCCAGALVQSVSFIQTTTMEKEETHEFHD
jgi:hypothetical protein